MIRRRRERRRLAKAWWLGAAGREGPSGSESMTVSWGYFSAVVYEELPYNLNDTLSSVLDRQRKRCLKPCVDVLEDKECLMRALGHAILLRGKDHLDGVGCPESNRFRQGLLYVESDESG